MAEYYGITTPTDDFLAHYGVKGMRWGVRKAIESGNQRKLDRQYKKAQKKLAKLESNADIDTQKKKSQKLNRISKISGAIGGASLAGLGALQGTKQVTRLLTESAMKKAADSDMNYWSALQSGNYSAADNYYTLKRAAQERANKRWDIHMNADRALTEVGPYLGIGSVAGIGTAVGTKIASKVAKNRTTEKGHAKAVAKRNAWRNEMAKNFKGTKYAKLPDLGGNQKNKGR